MTDPIAWYDANAELASDRYESVTFERVHGWLADLLPKPPAPFSTSVPAVAEMRPTSPP